MFDLLSTAAEPGQDAVDAALVVGWIGALGAAQVERTDSDCIDLMASLERLKGAAAATQARVTARFARSQRVAAVTRNGPDDPWITRELERKADRSVWSQVALARRESPRRGQQHVGLANALVKEMPYTLAALSAGDITEWQATLVVRETAVLSAEDRVQVDRELAGQLGSLGDRGVADAARQIGDRLDPGAAMRRLDRAKASRRVSIRPAPDSMSRLTGLVPMAEGVAAFAVLRQHADSLRAAGDQRNVGAIMADEFFAGLTGRQGADAGGDGAATPSSPNVEIGLVMSERAMLRGGTDPALLTGPDGSAFGHLPARLARALVRNADKAWLRRLYAAPETGELVAMDTTRRTFTGRLRQLLVWRDQTCRTPWCEAPIRHIDHVRSVVRHGGQTAVANGQGLCEACNYAKESPGWRTNVLHSPGHVVEITTPLGRHYRSKAPPTPGQDPPSVEERLRRLSDDWIDGVGA